MSLAPPRPCPHAFLLALLLACLLAPAPSWGSAPEPAGSPDRPAPWLWFREQFALGGWPSLVQSETRLQGRAALHRADSAIFRATYAGAGGVLAVSPAFVRVGPRLSIQPVDFFELEVQGDWALVFPMSSGLLPYDVTSGKLNSQRDERKDEAVLGQMWSVTVSPTLKLKAGPVIVLANVQFIWAWVIDPDPERSAYVYDAARDLAIERRETMVQGQYALLGEILPGGDRPLLRAGAVARHRVAFGSGDRSLVVGGMVMVKPSPRPAWPTLILQVLPYVIDADRVGSVPQVVLAGQWEVSRPKGGPAR